MEIIATANETAHLIAESKRKDFIVFPEDRLNPVKMYDRLPYRWIEKGITNSFHGEASKGEYYTYQLGIYALQSLLDVTVEFSDLKDSKGNSIPAKNISCLNTSAINYEGNPVTKNVSIENKRIQPLWCGIDVPQNSAAGIYKGTVIIKCKNAAPAAIAITFTVNNKTLADGGISEPQKQTRLKWLNSVLYQDNTVIKPYIPLQSENNTISLLGRKLELNNDGFPKQIQTFFTTEMTGYKNEPNNILAEPIHFNFIKTNGEPSAFRESGLQFIKQTPGTIQWKAVNSNNELQMDVNASIEFDGFVAYTVKVTALQDVSLKDISLQIPFTKESSKYMMGLNQKGGYRPTNFDGNGMLNIKTRMAHGSAM